MGKYTENLRPSLKKFPVPTLSSTLNELAIWVAPFDLTGGLHVAEEIDEFSKNQSVIKAQKELEEYAANQPDNWLSPLWVENYLQNRGSLQNTSNISLVITPSYIQEKQSLAEIATTFTLNLAWLYNQLVLGKIPYEKTPKGENLDMSFYPNFMKSARIPGEETDEYYVGKQAIENNYIVFICRGIYYQIPVTDDNGLLFHPDLLVKQLNEIISNQKYSHDYISSYTGLPRVESAAVYQEMKQNEENARNLQIIEDSLFVLSYSDEENLTQNQRVKESLLGPKDKYFSKVTQLTINKNKEVYVSFEHSNIDGVPALNMLTAAFEERPEVRAYTNKEERYQRLEWKLTKEQQETLKEAQIQCEMVANNYAFSDGLFTGFGKNKIKEMGVSPDAFFHMALNLAVYRLYKEQKSIYEPVAMRAYYQGRTESARSLNEGKWKFAQAFDNQEENEILITYFTEGVTEHGRRAKLCQQGKGVERHLFGLKKILEKEQKTVKLFENAALQEMQGDFISSTGIPFDVMNSFTFVPSDENGFGVYYGLLEDKILLTTSAFASNEVKPSEINQAIHQALLDIAKWRQGNK